MLAIPASIGLILASEEIVSALLGYGSFDAQNVKMTAEALKYFGYGIPAFALVKILSNTSTQFVMHYARQDLLWLKYHLKVEPKNIFLTDWNPKNFTKLLSIQEMKVIKAIAKITPGIA